jgi:3-phosphoshikimate 1-carboxyvinyltransferase
MLIAPAVAGGIRQEFAGAVTSESYVEMTAAVLRRWGLECQRSGSFAAVPAQPIAARDLAIEPDASSATYWLTAAAIIPGSTIRIPGLTSTMQADSGYGPLLASMGATCAIERGALTLAAPQARVAPPGPMDMSRMPDAALSLAVFAATGAAPISITGLRTLRVKESDRIAALATELERVGCTVGTTESSITIDPRRRHERACVIETYDDHRMAMAFAVLGLARPGISIRDPGCVAKSYPAFWRDLATLYT